MEPKWHVSNQGFALMFPFVHLFSLFSTGFPLNNLGLASEKLGKFCR